MKTSTGLMGLLVLSAIVFGPVAAYAYDPPTGADDRYDLYSPLFLGRGFSVTSLESPTADAMNPASSGLTQRTTLDASYIGLTGFGDKESNRGWQGHVGNLAASFPTRAGVITGGLQFLHTDLDPIDLGTTLGLRASFSKDLYPDLLFGVGVSTDVGGDASRDFGVAGDLGIMYIPGALGPLKDFRWGLSLLRMGLPYNPVDGTGVPSAFTPATGISFVPFRRDGVDLEVNSAVSLPSFQNFRLSLGTELTIQDRVSLFGGWRGDVRELFDSSVESRSLLPSIGLSVKFSTNIPQDESIISQQGWNQSELHTRVAAAPLHDGIWAFGTGVNAPLGVIDRNPPEITVDYDETFFFSPNNDGVQDALEFPVSTVDERYVMGYRFSIYNADGELVREIRNKEDRPENRTLENIVQRLLAVEEGIPVPDTFRWGGRTDSGAVAPDGLYRFSVEAWDDNGNAGEEGPYEVVLDNTPPSAEIERLTQEDRIFSPDGDGRKDVLVFDQSGSVELRWTGVFLDNEGTVLREYEWLDVAPDTLTWDGQDGEGQVVPDGVYRYRLSSQDRAGNDFEAALENIIVNTLPTPVRLSINRSHFSPNADGVSDTVVLDLDVPVTAGIVNWTVDIEDPSGQPVRRYSGLRIPPDTVAFDGRNDAGDRLPEDSYRGRLTVEYQNGSRPVETSPSFVIDVTPPSASVRSDFNVFSPDGDGQRDRVRIFQEATDEELWTGEIRDSLGNVVRRYEWRGTVEPTITWDGRQADGRPAPDGEYSYRLSAVDRAGNTGRSAPIGLEIDTGETEVIISAEFDAFSPNADGTRDRIRIFPQILRNDDVVNYEFRVRNAGGTVVRTTRGNQPIREPFSWNGADDEGRTVPDGRYRGDITVTYRNGNVEEAQTDFFIVDTVPPEIDAMVSTDLFSPDGDGRLDTVRINQSSTDEALWEARIEDRQGRVLRSYFWKGEVSDVAWDGTDESGNPVTDGDYTYLITASDEAGNSTEWRSPAITVDTRPTNVFVTVDKTGFSPNADGVVDEIEFSVYANVLDGIDDWRLSMVHETEGVLRTFEGDTLLATNTIVWDGRSDDGRRVEGSYTAEFVVEYAKGNRPVGRTTPFVLDITPPNVSIDLEPVPFSPDNDGVDDELNIYIDVTDASPIQGWQMVILDRNDSFFTEFAGRGMPSERLIWDGRAQNGELVISAEDYPYEFSISDAVGNVRRTQGIIPVDILVIRDGDRLKVQISNITFEPNSPELVLDPTDERGAKNRAILRRLVEVFTKYDDYDVRVEGHAVNVTGTEREEREELQPLSLSRAESVRDALIEEGLSPRRLSVLGRGGTEPIVPHTNLEERWKNRRVEFILIR
jgi:flagellar hook assembly protein FlgD/outer membrane protein OmpA-like peptidoglycan-associated protein